MSDYLAQVRHAAHGSTFPGAEARRSPAARNLGRRPATAGISVARCLSAMPTARKARAIYCPWPRKYNPRGNTIRTPGLRLQVPTGPGSPELAARASRRRTREGVGVWWVCVSLSAGHPDRLGVPVTSIRVSPRAHSSGFPSGATVRMRRSGLRRASGPARWPVSTPPSRRIGTDGAGRPGQPRRPRRDGSQPLARETITATSLSRQ